MQGHPENRVFAGDVLKDIFSYKDFQKINKLEKSSTRSDFWNEDRTDMLTKNYKHEGSLQTLLNYGYFIKEHQFGWPAPDEA